MSREKSYIYKEFERSCDLIGRGCHDIFMRHQICITWSENRRNIYHHLNWKLVIWRDFDYYYIYYVTYSKIYSLYCHCYCYCLQVAWRKIRDDLFLSKWTHYRIIPLISSYKLIFCFKLNLLGAYNRGGGAYNREGFCVWKNKSSMSHFP